MCHIQGCKGLKQQMPIILKGRHALDGCVYLYTHLSYDNNIQSMQDNQQIQIVLKIICLIIFGTR